MCTRKLRYLILNNLRCRFTEFFISNRFWQCSSSNGPIFDLWWPLILPISGLPTCRQFWAEVISIQFNAKSRALATYVWEEYDLCLSVTIRIFFAESSFSFSTIVTTWSNQLGISYNHDPQAHVLASLLKSLRAYNVKSSSTLFLDNIQWNFEIYFPCARFNSLLGYNLITKSWDHQKWDFQTPISWNWKNTLLCEIYFFEKL